MGTPFVVFRTFPAIETLSNRCHFEHQFLFTSLPHDTLLSNNKRV